MGLRELHRHKIVHRDIKPANILVSNGVFKIADFGLVKYTLEEEEIIKSRVGSAYYMSPQILLGQPYTHKCDIWSLGVMLYEMAYRRMPWAARNEPALIRAISQQPRPFYSAGLYKVNRLLRSMLQIQ